jgi:CRISPR-associated endonuclease/helicase Cas3
LDRLGWRKWSEAVIILRQTRHDPVYQGRAQAAFEWFEDHATREGQQVTIDFGIQALDALLHAANTPPPVEDIHPAPVLLPTFLDLWVQTHPAPAPTPDVAPFLHGPQPQALDVHVVWRADLLAGQEPQWADIVALLPPHLPEALPVPIAAVRAWLSHQAPTVVSDVEGAPLDPAAAGPVRSPRRVLRWRGEETTPEQDLIPAQELRGARELGRRGCVGVASRGYRPGPRYCRSVSARPSEGRPLAPARPSRPPPSVAAAGGVRERSPPTSGGVESPGRPGGR